MVSILASCSDIVKAAASRQSGDPDMQIPGSEVFEGLAGIVGPAVALEYLEYGDMMGIISKIRPTDRNVPNRVLWSFFCCCTYFN